MADVFDWSTTPASNTTLDGINVNTGMPVANVDNAIRALMAATRNTFNPTLESFLNGSAALPIASGGTGGATASAARIALGLGTAATRDDAYFVQTAGTAYVSTANGYYHPVGNGLIEQWGKVSTTQGEGPIPITFPTPFTEIGTVNVQLTIIGNASINNDMWVQLTALSITTFTAYYQQSQSGQTGYGFHWRALGK